MSSYVIMTKQLKNVLEGWAMRVSCGVLHAYAPPMPKRKNKKKKKKRGETRLLRSGT